jgi:hypothetical protein
MAFFMRRLSHHNPAPQYWARSIAEAPKRIKAICLDLIEHSTTTIAPKGYEAQVVACSRGRRCCTRRPWIV